MSNNKDVDLTTTVGSSDSIDRDVKISAVVSDKAIEQEFKTTSRWRRVIGYVWDSAEGTPRNRRYVQRLDAYML